MQAEKRARHIAEKVQQRSCGKRPFFFIRFYYTFKLISLIDMFILKKSINYEM